MKNITIFLFFTNKSTLKQFEIQLKKYDSLPNILKEYFQICVINTSNLSLEDYPIEVYYSDAIITYINTKWAVILHNDYIISTIGYYLLLKKTICISDFENKSIFYLYNNKIDNNDNFLIQSVSYKYKYEYKYKNIDILQKDYLNIY